MKKIWTGIIMLLVLLTLAMPVSAMDDGVPNVAIVTVNKDVFEVGEPVTFTITVDGTSTMLWVSPADVSNKGYYEDVGDTVTLVFERTGEYTAYVETWGENGQKLSEMITFHVEPKATTAPTTKPTTVPTTKPTTVSTTKPTTKPTSVPTTKPTTEPTTEPTTQPSTQLTQSTIPSTTVPNQSTPPASTVTQPTDASVDREA